MGSKKTYQYSIVEKLSFNRYGGTEDEARAAKIIADEVKRLGGEPEIMEFEIPAYELHSCSLKVTAPYEKNVEVVPYGLTGNLPEGGAEFKLRYIEDTSPQSFVGITDLSDTAVLINELNWDMYRRLYELKAGAFILIANDKWYNSDETTDLIPREIREEYLEIGKIPGFSVRSSDAIGLMRNKAEKVRLELRETEGIATSRDVLAVIPGTEFPEESVVITAHFDSVLVGTGSWDNATGSATIMYIYRHFLANPPKRTMRFIWCGSEEQGLYGSINYIKQHRDLLPEIKFCFNFDMCGTLLGANRITVTGGEELKNYAEQLAMEYGYPTVVNLRVHSSDSAPFADEGIPSMGIGRGTKSSEIHTRNDLLYPISSEKLYENGEFAVFAISRFINSAVLPVKREIPESMKKEVDKYFWKDKLSQLKKD